MHAWIVTLNDVGGMPPAIRDRFLAVSFPVPLASTRLQLPERSSEPSRVCAGADPQWAQPLTSEGIAVLEAH